MRLPSPCPVLARPRVDGGTDVQVGLAAPVTLTELGLSERAFVESLEGGRPVSAAQARRFGRVVGILTAAGIWDAEDVRAPSARVAVWGAGALGMDIAAAVHRAGLEVALHDAAASEVEPVGTYVATATGTCAGAAAATLAARGHTVGVAGGGESLAVITCMGAPDQQIINHYAPSATPYVLVACDGPSVWVSHVVVHGRSACSRCRDLALARLDPAWPSLALQLAGSGISTRRPLVHGFAGATAGVRVASRLLGWLVGEDVGVAERIDATGRIVAEPLEAEPGCGCGGAGAVGDEVAARRARWR
ncbi:hypothetical protein [Demequina sp.]|uniref:hypothetical protein n=1 Tax=Demequina sp. TaxID=2050685 RepID=UPI003D0FA873